MDKKIILNLAIFDFDGTLIDTETPITGKQIWEEKTGKPWPHIGWWSKPESLDSEIFKNDLITSVKEAYDIVKSEDETLSVMMTGRKLSLAPEVMKVLKSHDLEFDECHFNTGGKTEVCKMRTIDKLLNKYTQVNEVSIWEDREEHIHIFHDFLVKKVEEGKLKHFKINYVPSHRDEDKTH
jgi:hypothetical protein